MCIPSCFERKTTLKTRIICILPLIISIIWGYFVNSPDYNYDFIPEQATFIPPSESYAEIIF